MKGVINTMNNLVKVGTALTGKNKDEKISVTKLVWQSSQYKINKSGNQEGNYIKAEDVIKILELCANSLANYIENTRFALTELLQKEINNIKLQCKL